MKGLNATCCLGFCLALSSCTNQPKAEYLKGDTMGTIYTVHFWDEERVSTQKLGTGINELLNAFEDELSNWRADSWISRFNAEREDKPIPVPEHAFRVLRLSLELAERSSGVLDPTVSPLVELWGFGSEGEHQVPDEPSIELTLKKVGYEKLVLDSEHQTALKLHPGLQLNCSAVAKGYAVDLVAQFLKDRKVENFLVNIGGEVSARGSKPDGFPWSVRIEQPQVNGRMTKSARTVSLTNRSLATSGHSRRAFVSQGRRYSHILHPQTGHPVPADIASTTVIAPNCALADGLATLALILDEDQMSDILDYYDAVEVFRTGWSTADVAQIP